MTALAPVGEDLRTLLVPEPGDGPVYLRCPAHEDGGRPNLAVYPDHTHCYRCGFHEWPGEFVVRVTQHPEQAVVEETWRPRTAASHHVDWAAAAKLYQRNLFGGARKARLDWLTGRGLSMDTIERALLGHDGVSFAIPYRSPEGRVVGVKFRRDDACGTDGPKYRNSPGLTGLYRPNPGGRPTVVVEGEFDALILGQYGLDAVTAATGATGLVAQILHTPLPRRRVWVATDWDEAGETAARELLTHRAGWTRLERPVPGVKDVTEWVLALPLRERGLTLREVLRG
jgi:Toprim-like